MGICQIPQTIVELLFRLCLCIILELVLIKKCEDSLDTSELQFGFKQEHSMTMCTFLVKVTVNYFNARGSPVYACFLDASKAFDRVKHEA